MTIRIAFPAHYVDAVRAERIVCVIKRGDKRYKAFQIAWGGDGSLYVNFPYFPHREGILTSFVLAGDGRQETVLKLEQSGKVVSHLVKYSHHPSGQANFSQTGRVRTEIKRQSVPLSEHNGHIFTLQIQGIERLKPADEGRDSISTVKRALIDFPAPAAPAVKFVARWFHVSKILLDRPTPVVGPWIGTRDPDDNMGQACLIGRPESTDKQFLAVSLLPQAELGHEREILIFQGGFDARAKMDNIYENAGGLMFKYPIENARVLAERIGSVDFKAKK